MVRLVIFFGAFLFGMQVFAADCGRFAVVKQPVKWKKQGKKKYKKATKNKQICQGDAVKTGPNGRVRIVMDDNNEINVSPNSELIIESYKDGKKAVLNVLNGKVRSDVNNKYQNSQSSHFRVKTKSAVAGVRGTQFLTSYNAQTNQARIVTFEGRVEVGSMNGTTFEPKVTVNPGQFTSSNQNQEPHPPKQVPPAELAQMDRESKVDAGAGSKAPASTNNQGNKKEEPKSDEKKEAPKNEPKQEPKADEPKQEEPKADGSAKNDQPAAGEDSKGKRPRARVGKGPRPKGPSLGPNGGDEMAREDDQYGDPNFDPASGDNASNDGSKNGGGRGIASVEPIDGGNGNIPAVDTGGNDMGLPPPTLDDMPGAGDQGFIEPPKIPTLNPIIGQLPECTQCNDAIINQKVRVIIRPVLSDGTIGNQN